MVEDAHTSTKHCRRRRVMGFVRGTIPGEVLTEEFIEFQINEFNAL
jgi:hypothetical protein